MDTKLIAEDLRKLTLSKEFSFDEFKDIVQLTHEQAFSLLNNMVLDCWVKPSGKKGWVVLHGEGRTEQITNRIKMTEQKIREYFALLKHLILYLHINK